MVNTVIINIYIIMKIAVFALLFLIFIIPFTHRLIAAEGADCTFNLSQDEIVGGAPLAVTTQVSASLSCDFKKYFYIVGAWLLLYQ